MFYLTSLRKDICLYPYELNNNIENTVINKIKDLEGKIFGENGYIVKILDCNQLSDGRIDNETARVYYKMSFKTITFKLQKDELTYVIPHFINEYGVFCKIGKAQVFISKHVMENWKYDNEKNIWKFNDSEEICIDKLLLVKIVRVRINSDEINAIGILLE
jgi:DNA-directed RNA polymerase subunit E'/Rpb7